MKRCSKCNDEKDHVFFGKDATKKDGLSTVCLDCRRKYDRERQHSVKRIEFRKSERLKKWYSEYNKSEKYKSWRRFYQNNVYRKKNKNRIAHNVRTLMRQCMIRNSNTKLFEYTLGCKMREFKLHISSMFVGEMSFENYGKLWEFDHIKPLSLFDLTNETEFLVACHYSNVQPLFREENRKKSKAETISKDKQLKFVL